MLPWRDGLASIPSDGVDSRNVPALPPFGTYVFVKILLYCTITKRHAGKLIFGTSASYTYIMFHLRYGDPNTAGCWEPKMLGTFTFVHGCTKDLPVQVSTQTHKSVHSFSPLQDYTAYMLLPMYILLLSSWSKMPFSHTIYNLLPSLNTNAG